MRSHFGMSLAGGHAYNGKQEVVDTRIAGVPIRNSGINVIQ